MDNRVFDTYFFILFSFIPISLVAGSAVSITNILLIDLSFIFFLLYKKDYKFLSNKTVKIILLCCLYLIFNSIISKDSFIGAWRNFGFIRFGILFCAFNYFFYHKKFFHKILIVWTVTLIIISIDIYLESFSGKNILGYGDTEYGRRIVSFFKDEPIVGGYVNAFYLIIIGYVFTYNGSYSEKYKNFFLIFSIFLFLSILLTGERSSAIKAILGFLIFYFINDHFKPVQKIISILALLILMGGLFFSFNSQDMKKDIGLTEDTNIEFLKLRYNGQFLHLILEQFKSKEKRQKNFEENQYFRLYRSAYNVFKNYPLFGVGNKNYRIETCENKINNDEYFCNTHPHQTYFEFLAEHGLIGSLILLFIFFSLIFSKLKIILKSKNYLQLGCFIYLLILFIPILPSGAFFNDYNLTLFWINLSLMYSAGKETNIYSSN